MLLQYHVLSKKKVINTSDKKMVVINNQEYIKWITGEKYESWSPNSSDFNEIDSILQVAIVKREFLPLQITSLNELKERYRQYVCYFDEDGNKIVYINSFCEIPTIYENGKEKQMNWHREMVDVADGGSCYWNMKINMTLRTYDDLIINGES